MFEFNDYTGLYAGFINPDSLFSLRRVSCKIVFRSRSQLSQGLVLRHFMSPERDFESPPLVGIISLWDAFGGFYAKLFSLNPDISFLRRKFMFSERYLSLTRLLLESAGPHQPFSGVVYVLKCLRRVSFFTPVGVVRNCLRSAFLGCQLSQVLALQA